MEEVTMDFGVRVLQHVKGSYLLNVPMVVVRSFELEPRMPLHLYLKGRTLMIELPEKKIVEDNRLDE